MTAEQWLVDLEAKANAAISMPPEWSTFPDLMKPWENAMPAYNLQARFAPLVASGEKRQTIRATGKRRSGRLLDGRESD